ncbi:MAG: hypothetical protein HY369_01005 [Candidatus Aenigmarchaeota archaeon]|nr:hypothetical protein [Candidatus Aenigmarchaeota archaeon]
MGNSILGDLFLREKPVRIITGIKSAKGGVYATILAKEADCTYSHTIKILNVFQKLGMVSFEKKGRIKRVILTDDGWEIAQNLETVVKKFTTLQDAADDKAKKKVKK